MIRRAVSLVFIDFVAIPASRLQPRSHYRNTASNGIQLRMLRCLFLFCCSIVCQLSYTQTSPRIYTVKRVYLQAVSCFCGHSRQHGNIFVEYDDGTKEQLTSNNCASAPQMTPDRRTIGWEEGSHFYVSKYNEYLLSRENLICYRDGHILHRLAMEHSYVDQWGFYNSSQFATSAVGTHGPTYYQLFDVITGKQITSASSYPNNSPSWTKSLYSGKMPDQQPEQLTLPTVNRNQEPGASVKAETAFLKAIPKEATFDVARKLLPINTRFSKPQRVSTECFVGNKIEFTGQLNGALFFRSREQLAKDNLTQSTPRHDIPYDDKDIAYVAMLLMDVSVKYYTPSVSLTEGV